MEFSCTKHLFFSDFFIMFIVFSSFCQKPGQNKLLFSGLFSWLLYFEQLITRWVGFLPCVVRKTLGSTFLWDGEVSILFVDFLIYLSGLFFTIESFFLCLLSLFFEWFINSFDILPMERGANIVVLSLEKLFCVEGNLN